MLKEVIRSQVTLSRCCIHFWLPTPGRPSAEVTEPPPFHATIDWILVGVLEATKLEESPRGA